MHKIQLLPGLGAVWHRPAVHASVSQVLGPLSVHHADPRRRAGRSRASFGFKRLVDIVASGLGLLVLAPLLVLIALLILVCDGRPVLYRHRRIGRGGRSFDCFKFRSMARDADARLQSLLATSTLARREWAACRKLTVDPRVHASGDLLRRSSLDELPQLLNILRGEMSLVGPRPIVDDEIARFGPYFADYKAVRPGLTGLWQVSGRSDTTYEERVALDHHYVIHGSTAVDLRILLRTPVVVWKGQGSR